MRDRYFLDLELIEEKKKLRTSDAYIFRSNTQNLQKAFRRKPAEK